MNHKDNELVVYADQLPLKIRLVNRNKKSKKEYNLLPSRDKSGMFLKTPDLPYKKSRN